MNLDQLEVLVAVAESGSFRAAADRLHRSQPALSTTIKNLEEEFELVIFDRTEYRPKLTEAGTAFLAMARSTLQSAHYTSRVGVELGKQKAETRLNISVDPLISTEILELIALECARPTLPVNLVIDKSILNGSHQPLLDGVIDLAIGPCPNKSHQIEVIPLENVTLIGAVSKKLLQEKQKPTEEFLLKHPQILVYDKRFDEPPDSLLPNAIFEDAGHKIFVPDHFTKIKLIEGGIGWGQISEHEFENTQHLIAVDKTLCPELLLQLCLLRPKLRSVGPIARAIWKKFEERNKHLN